MARRKYDALLVPRSHPGCSYSSCFSVYRMEWFIGVGSFLSGFVIGAIVAAFMILIKS